MWNLAPPARAARGTCMHMPSTITSVTDNQPTNQSINIASTVTSQVVARPRHHAVPPRGPLRRRALQEGAACAQAAAHAHAHARTPRPLFLFACCAGHPQPPRAPSAAVRARRARGGGAAPPSPSGGRGADDQRGRRRRCSALTSLAPPRPLSSPRRALESGPWCCNKSAAPPSRPAKGARSSAAMSAEGEAEDEDFVAATVTCFDVGHNKRPPTADGASTPPTKRASWARAAPEAPPASGPEPLADGAVVAEDLVVCLSDDDGPDYLRGASAEADPDARPAGGGSEPDAADGSEVATVLVRAACPLLPLLPLLPAGGGGNGGSIGAQ
eukprot:scaffold734_cov352-Prasinococcus_capsulatus_cf.AAC.8